MKSAPIHAWPLLLLAVTSCCSQDLGRPARPDSLDARAALRALLYPPQNVTVKFGKEGAIVDWEPIRIDRMSDYEVYRWSGKGKEKWEKAGKSAHPPFIDPKVRDKRTRYKVVALDRYGNRSELNQSETSRVLK